MKWKKVKLKKAEQFIPGKLIGIVIVLFFLVIIFFAFFAPKGMINKVFERASSLVKYIPEKRMEAVGEIPIPVDIKEAYDSLVKAFQDGQQSSYSGYCFLEYKEIPELNDYKIELFKADGLNIRLVTPKGQTTEAENIPDLEPCIVAGIGNGRNAAQNFYSHYIDARVPKTGDGKMYTAKDRLTIIESSDIARGEDEEIMPGNYDTEDESLKNSNGEEISMLYKADEGHICFFVTNDGINYNENGINDNYIHDIYYGRNTAENYQTTVLGTPFGKTGGPRLLPCPSPPRAT